MASENRRFRRGIGGAAVLAAFVGFLAVPAGAAPQQTDPHVSETPASAETPILSLPEAVAEALSHAPAIEAAAEREQAARWKATAAQRSRLGELDAVAGYVRYQDDQVVRPISRQLLEGGFAGLPFDRDQWRYGFTFQVPLYVGGRLSASISAAELQAGQAAALLEGSRWQVRFNVVSLYAAAQTLDAVAAATDANLAALEETRRRVDLAVRLGKRPGLDLLKLDDEMAEARARRAGVDADAARVRGLLLALLGRDPAGALRVMPLPGQPPVLDATRDQLRALALAASPVTRASLAADEARQSVRIARAGSLPSVVGRASHLWNDAPSVGAPLRTWELSVGAVWPIFTGGSRGAEKAAAEASERAAAAALARARLEQEAALVEALARWDASGTALASGAARVAAAAEAARIEQIRYDTGAGAVDDLLRARARELAASAALAQARGDAMVAAARVDAVCEKEVVR